MMEFLECREIQDLQVKMASISRWNLRTTCLALSALQALQEREDLKEREACPEIQDTQENQDSPETSGQKDLQATMAPRENLDCKDRWDLLD